MPKPNNEPVQPHRQHSKVYISIPEKRLFILSKSEDAVYVHYLSPVSNTDASAIWWDADDSKYYFICETKCLSDQERIFYISEPAGKLHTLIVNERCDETPAFLSKPTINPIWEGFQYHHCEFDINDGYDELLTHLNQNERMKRNVWQEKEEALAQQMEELRKKLAHLKTDDCDAVSLSSVVYRKPHEHAFVALLSQSITSNSAPLAGLSPESRNHLLDVDFQSLQELGVVLNKAFAKSTHHYCALLHHYITSSDLYREDRDFVTLCKFLDSWVGRSHDIKTHHHYGNPRLALPLLMAEKKKRLKYVLAAEIQQYYPNYSVQQRVMQFEDLKGHMKHVETNHTALIHQLKQAAIIQDKDSARAHFESYVLKQVRHILEHEKSQDKMHSALRTLLHQAWDIANGTWLSYNAQPDNPVNHLLYSIAAYTAEPANTAEPTKKDQNFVSNVLQELMPEITGYCMPEVRGRHISDVANVFRTHIFSQRVKTLVPLTSVINAVLPTSSERYRYLKDITVPNPLGNLDPDAKDDQYFLSWTDLKPAFSHSDQMRQLMKLKNDYDDAIKNSPIIVALYSLITHLLKRSTTHLGSAVEEEADESVYAGLPQKLDFYTKLTEEDKAQFPSEVKDTLDRLINAAGDTEVRTREAGNFITCLAMQAKTLERAVGKNIKALSKLSNTLYPDKSQNVASFASQLESYAQNLKNDIKEGRYSGSDQGIKECHDICAKLKSKYNHPNPVKPSPRISTIEQAEHTQRHWHWTNGVQTVLTEAAKEGIEEMRKLIASSDSRVLISFTALIVLAIDSLLERGKYEVLEGWISTLNAATISRCTPHLIALNRLYDVATHAPELKLDSFSKVSDLDFEHIVASQVLNYLDSNPDRYDDEDLRSLMSRLDRTHRMHHPTIYESSVSNVDYLRAMQHVQYARNTYKKILKEMRVSFRKRADCPKGQYVSEDGTVKFSNERDKSKDTEFGRLLAQDSITRGEVNKLVSRTTMRHVGIFGRWLAPTSKREFKSKAGNYPELEKEPKQIVIQPGNFFHLY